VRSVAEKYRLLESEGQLTRLTGREAEDMARGPVTLKQLSVTRPPNTYLLKISYRASGPALAADVANAVADSYLAHTYDIRIRSSAGLALFMEKQLGELRAKMEKSGEALAQFEKDLDVVNPDEKTNILSARLLQLNTEYTAAQADRAGKEAAWNAMRAGSLAAAQVSAQGTNLAQLMETLNRANQRFALVKSTYGFSHPEYAKAASEVAEVERQVQAARANTSKRIEVEYAEARNREQILQKAVADTKAEWDRINSQSFGYQQLKREADADKSLYDELVRKIREADINAGFQNNNIRIANLARPPLHPVSPNMPLNLALTFILSSLLGVAAVMTQDRLDTTLRDPQESSRFLGTDVIGTVPLDRVAAKVQQLAVDEPVAAIERKPRKDRYRSTSDFEESVRTIRNTILLSDFDNRLRSLVVTSAAPGEGKTTIAAHLAIANAERGKKTLLVDGDLRRPGLQAQFGSDPKSGFSNVLSGELPWREAIISVAGRPNLSLLPSGPASDRAANLIGPRLSTLLTEFGTEYDLIILDSPPVLGFAECLQMAAAADGVVIVSQAGKTRRRAVVEVISLLARLRADVVGVVLNQMSRRFSLDGHSYSTCYGSAHYRQSADRSM
jgi:capsular exopolysaccharide synthesis family protein